ncbi:predicted protein [Botrytis cinerea T4]|uniref:Uncharacterized protein n=1 Tax=Botryotinia fuckeliana (strain T4) TaxID=999810 RepID=G2XVG9_BOTF4|nr:predicted protein [Botrytis cinerea T4]
MKSKQIRIQPRFPTIKLTTKYPYSIILACGRKREAPRFVLHYGNCQ